MTAKSQIPDYRGPQGVWTLKEQGVAVQKLELQNAVPSLTHRALFRLQEKGYICGVVTTNIDNLHLKAGMSREHVAELHGNSFREHCIKCGKTFERDYDVTRDNPVKDLSSQDRSHRTGGKCDECQGDLHDTIVTFGEQLPLVEFTKATDMSKGSALALVLGTSMRVRPANQLPLMAAAHFIVNSQATPLDLTACETVHTRCDLLMALVMKHLGFGDDEFALDDSMWEEYNVSRDRSLVAPINNTNGGHNKKKPTFKATTPAQGKVAILNEAALLETNPIDVDKRPALLEKCGGNAVLVGNPLKVVLVGCSDLRVTLRGRVIGGVVEIIQCNNTVVAFDEMCPVLQVDGSRDCIFNFGAKGFGSVINSADCQNLSITDGTLSVPICWSAEEKSPYVQYLSRWDGGGLLTEQVVREGGGYATTQREKDLADAKDAKNQKLMENYVRTLIKTKKTE